MGIVYPFQSGSCCHETTGIPKPCAMVASETVQDT